MKITTPFRGPLASGAALLFAAACASAPRVRAPDSCVLGAADSVFLAGGPVFRDCAVDRKAKLIASSVRPDFRPPMNGVPQVGTTCYRAEVRLVVSAGGTVEPGTPRLVQATTPAFGRAILESAVAWRYEPARLDGKPVRQVAREKQAVAVRVSVEGQMRDPLPPRC